MALVSGIVWWERRLQLRLKSVGENDEGLGTFEYEIWLWKEVSDKDLRGEICCNIFELLASEEEKSVKTTMRGRKAMARCGWAEEEEVNVDTRQQREKQQSQNNRGRKKNRDIEERQRVFMYLFRIFNFSRLILDFWIELWKKIILIVIFNHNSIQKLKN
jgi:hypothetical protein